MIFAIVIITPDNLPNRAMMIPRGIPTKHANKTPYTDINK